jgi:hypothetical protein
LSQEPFLFVEGAGAEIVGKGPKKTGLAVHAALMSKLLKTDGAWEIVESAAERPFREL